MRRAVPQIGDMRVSSGFAWLPVCAPLTPTAHEDQRYEWRWLERVTVVRRFTDRYGGGWETVCFFDTREQARAFVEGGRDE
jgi:hypothetical protein